MATDPRFRGLSFMPPLVQPVLRGDKTVTRRTGRKPAEVGDLLWIREAWLAPRTYDALTPLGIVERVRAGFTIPIYRHADHAPDLYPGANWGRYRHARFMPLALARPWRGRVVSVERVPAPPEGIDDDEAIREGVRRCDPGVPPIGGHTGTPEELASLLGRSIWSLDGEGWADTPTAAFLAGWHRLHPDPSALHAGGVPGHVWRVEWVTEVVP